MEWGIRPILFMLGEVRVGAYQFFVSLALIVGLALYFYEIKKEKRDNMKGLYLVIFAVLGGAIGAKIPLVFMYWDKIVAEPNRYNLLLSGRTIIGGLLGGFFGAFMARKIFRIKERMGNQIAIPLVIGMAIGRVGCFFTGCCYGVATGLSIGVDFGDHILRHPTQLYELIFDLGLALFLIWKKRRNPMPGDLFRIFMNAYLSFRFFLEFIRVELRSPIGLTDFQLICIVSLLFINRKKIKLIFRGDKKKVEGVV